MGHAASKKRNALKKAADDAALERDAKAAEWEKAQAEKEWARQERRRKEFPEQLKMAKRRIAAAKAEGKDEATFGLKEINRLTRERLKQSGYKVSEDYDSILGPFYCVDWGY